MTIARRLFLRNTAAAGAVVAVAAPVVAAEPEMTPLEQVWWHIRELERLVVEDGSAKPIIIIQSEYGPKDLRGIGINIHGQAVNNGMFAAKGGPA